MVCNHVSKLLDTNWLLVDIVDGNRMKLSDIAAANVQEHILANFQRLCTHTLIASMTEAPQCRYEMLTCAILIICLDVSRFTVLGSWQDLDDRLRGHHRSVTNVLTLSWDGIRAIH